MNITFKFFYLLTFEGTNIENPLLVSHFSKIKINKTSLAAAVSTLSFTVYLNLSEVLRTWTEDFC